LCATVTLRVLAVTRPSLTLFYSVGMFPSIAQEASMNFNRQRHREDVLFVIALVIPAVLSMTRYVETQRQITQIARAQSQTQVAHAARPVDPMHPIVALQTRDERAGASSEWMPPAAYGAL
jgi:hypothetical protein